MQGNLYWPKPPAPGEGTPTPQQTPTPIIKIDSFTQWTDHTFPGYPHIPPLRRARWPEVPKIDHAALMGTAMPELGDKSVTQLINEGAYDEVWLFTDPTGGSWEGQMMVPEGDDGLDLNGPDPTVQALQKRMPLMGYNYESPYRNAMHAYGHRAENLFAAWAGGNRGVTCLVNRTENNDYNHFTRIRHCYAGGTATPMPPIPETQYGSIGLIHKSHNAVIDNPLDLNDPYDNSRDEQELSDADEWFNFPNVGQNARPIGSAAWQKWNYYPWWFNHLPRYEGQSTHTPPPPGTPTAESNLKSNNLWHCLAKPQCCPELRDARDSGTPQP